jgi:hypothetical protein
MSCTNCKGTGWVCEWHADKPWTPTSPISVESCGCGAGMPCPVCRPQQRHAGSDEAFAEAVHRAIEATAREFR